VCSFAPRGHDLQSVKERYYITVANQPDISAVASDERLIDLEPITIPTIYQQEKITVGEQNATA